MDTVGVAVGDEERPVAGERDVGRVAELPGLAALAAPCAHELVGWLLGRGHEHEVPHDGEHHRKRNDAPDDHAHDLEYTSQPHADTRRADCRAANSRRPAIRS